MWYECENGNSARPADVDATSSQVVVYVRRNIEFIPEHTQGDTVIPGHYRWEETKIPKEVWAVCEKVLGHDGALDDVYTALAELAEMIVGV